MRCVSKPSRADQLDALYYEFQMLDYAAAQCALPSGGEQRLSDMRVECFLLHARVLLAFFRVVPTTTSEHDTDVTVTRILDPAASNAPNSKLAWLAAYPVLRKRLDASRDAMVDAVWKAIQEKNPKQPKLTITDVYKRIHKRLAHLTDARRDWHGEGWPVPAIKRCLDDYRDAFEKIVDPAKTLPKWKTLPPDIAAYTAGSVIQAVTTTGAMGAISRSVIIVHASDPTPKK